MRSWSAPSFFILLALFLSPALCPASETRVQATGGLGTILDDETADLNLFLDGNPAGLLYLNTKDRFDLSGEWSSTDQEGPWGSVKTTVLTTLPDPSSTLPAYGGVMVFPDPHWAFQASGQVLSQQGFPAAGLLADRQTQDRYLGLVRGAYAFPIGVLGVEVSGTQVDRSYAAGFYDGSYEVVNGSSSEGSTRLKAGIAAVFPENYAADQTRFRAGVHWGTQLGDDTETRNFQLDPLAPPSFSVTQVWTTRDSMDWGAEVTMEVPSVLKMILDVHEQDGSVDMTQTSGTPVTLSYFGAAPPFRTGDLEVDWNFKWTLAGIETEDLKIGGGLSYRRDSTTDGTSGSSGLYQEFETRLGVGLDSPRDHLMGLQWTSVGTTGRSDLNRITFGGEKWISATWALRLGLTAEIDHPDPASYEDLVTVLDMGAGFEEAFGRADLRFRLGQTVNMSDSDDTIGLLEAQISGTLFL